jgi:hypothetical protein
MKLKSLGCLLLTVLCVCGLWAQSDANKGQIAGTVYDAKEAVIPNARVTIRNLQTGLSRELATTDVGQFRAVLLDPGRYEVTIKAAGFADSKLTDITLNVGSSVDLPVRMQVGATVTTIEVGETLVNVDLPAPQTVINTTAIENLPINGRRFHDFATLTPTVQVDPQRGSISIAAQRGINGNIMLDGTDYNNPFFGGLRGGERAGYVPTVPQTAVSEFQVVTAGYAPEYGRSTGGVVNAITKSGTNDYHGEGFYQIRHKETGLKTPFGPQVLETLQQFGGGIGGPLKKDKLFFFAAAERQKSKTPRQVFFGTLLTATRTPATQEAYDFYLSQQGPFKSTNDATATTGRLDYSFANGSRLTARFNFSDASAQNAITTGAALPTLDNRAVSGSGTEMDRTYTGTSQLTSILSPHVVNDLRFSGTHEDRPRTANTQTANIGNTFGNVGTRNFLPTVQDDTRYQINDGVSMTMGRHTLKVGGDYDYLTTFQSFGFNQFGSFSFRTTTPNTVLQAMSTAPGQNRFDIPNTVTYSREIGNLLADYHMHQVAFYAQDAFRLTPRFQLTFGLRWEGAVNPAPVANNTQVVNAIQAVTFAINGGKFDPATLHNNLNQFMPRLGFTWSPDKNNKTVIRGYTGLFYAASPMLIFGGTTNNFRLPPGDVSLALVDTPSLSMYQVFKQAGYDLNTFALDKLPVIPLDIVQKAATVLSGGAAPNPFNQASFTGTPNDFLNPRSFQAGLGFDREIARNWSVGAQANYINTVHLERNRDWNLPLPTLRASDGRAIFTRAQRPLPQYGNLTMRESSARSMYRGLTMKTEYRARKYQLGLNWTVSQAYSDDDNERTAGGFTYDNPFNMRAEYGYSNFDRRHQVGGYGVFYLPWGIETSATLSYLAGAPVDPAAGSDVNGDSSSSDRAYKAVGVPFARNSFRNKSIQNVSARFLKNFKFGERWRLQFSCEMFNLFNFANVIVQGSNLNYGPGINPDGSVAPARSTFLQLKRPSDGKYDPTNTQVGFPFQAQFGLRLFF